MSRTRRTFLVGTTIGLSGFFAGCFGTADQSEESGMSTTKTTAVTARSKRTVENSPIVESAKPTTNTVASQSSSDIHETTDTTVRQHNHSVIDFQIYNKTSDSLTVTVTITRLSKTIAGSFTATTERPQLSGELVLSETFELKPSSAPQSEAKVYRNPLQSEQPYAIKIAVHNGPTGIYYLNREHDDAKGVIARIHEQSIEFLQIVA